MKFYIQYRKIVAAFCSISLLLGITGCEKKLDYVSYGDLNSVVTTPEGVGATVNAAYTGLAGGGDWQGGAMAGTYSWKTQAMMTTDEGVCAWGGDWSRMFNLNFTPDFDWVTHNYKNYLPYISRITIAPMATIAISQIHMHRFSSSVGAG